LARGRRTVTIEGRSRKEERVSVLKELWTDERGQDLIEYALMAGLVAVAAGAMVPPMSASISTIFSKVESVIAAVP
jgi:pilus assembly protein Flp/PilA